MLALSNRSIPITGACHIDSTLYVRLSGSREAVDAARSQDPLAAASVSGDEIWQTISNFRLPGEVLWRLSVPPSSQVLLDESDVIDWAGAQRFIADPDFNPRHRLDMGHATLIRGPRDIAAPLAELSGPVQKITERLKQTFDPAGIMNPGRLYQDI
jgi:glycolate oxidase FAD binding subunit